MATFEPFIDFASSLGMVVVIYFGGRLAFQQTLPIEDLVAFFLSTWSCSTSPCAS